MTKLTDMQLILLTTACQREDGSLFPSPDTLGDKDAQIRKAIEALIKKDLAVEQEGMKADQSWRIDGDLNFGVIVTEAGRTIIDPPVIGDSPPSLPAENEADSSTPPAEPRVTKQSLVIDLLNRDGGATLDDMVTATGWLPHTTRAALTGLRKKGHEIAKEKVEGATRYQIKQVG